MATRKTSKPRAKAKPKEWTEARRKAFIVSVLRSGTRRWPEKYETLNEAKTEKKVNTATGRIAQHFKCASCRDDFPAKMVQVDHVKPAVGIEGFSSWDSFIEGLFCEKDNLQVLCSECHNTKSKGEREARRKK